MSIDISTSLSIDLNALPSIDVSSSLSIDGAERKFMYLLQHIDGSKSSQYEYQSAGLAMLDNSNTCKISKYINSSHNIR